jgi:DNA-binding MarR family transcriptional regulator
MAERIERPSLLLQVFALDQRAGALMRNALAAAPLRGDEFAVYSALRVLQPTTPTALGRQVGMRPTTLSSYLARMTAAGHLKRRRNPDDGRSSLVSLTAKGERVTVACFPGFRAAFEAFAEELAMPYGQASRVLATLTTALERAAERLAPD